MNVVVIVSDTFRIDHISSFGLKAPWHRMGREGKQFINTPNLDNLVAQSVSFDRFYVSSYPTIPCRIDMFTGRYSFPVRGWEPLSSADVTLPEIMDQYGYTTMMIFDTPPLANDEFNFTRGFSGWEWVRGQHRDRWITDPVSVEIPAKPYKISNVKGLRPYLLNKTRRVYERDWMCAKTLSTASDWLERNVSRDKFLLWIDMWDPHEPFDAPQHDLNRYQDPSYSGDAVIYPRYGRHNCLSPEEINDIRARYAAKITLVDRWIGIFLDRLATLGLDKNTIVIFTTDHGHLFAEHNLQGKPTGPLGQLYEITTRVPLVIRHPHQIAAGTRISSIAQHVDLMPTILDMVGLPIPETVVGKPLWRVVQGDAKEVRQVAVSGRYSRSVNILGVGLSAKNKAAATFDGWVGVDFVSEPITVTSTKWTLICPPQGGPSPELYDIENDPQQQINVFTPESTVAEHLLEELIAFLKDNGSDEARISAYDWRTSDEDLQNRKGLDPGTPVYTFVVDNQMYGFLSDEEAQEMLSLGPSNIEVQQVALRDLRHRQSKALICVGDQYYWTEDVMFDDVKGGD